MSDPRDSAKALMDLIARKAPEYFDLLTARTDAEFDTALVPLLERVIKDLEANKASFDPLGEVALSATLKIGLNVPGLAVTQEGYTNGHVDLTIRGEHCVPEQTRLAEAKIYDGPAYTVEGLKQLFARYMTGREGSGLLIVYFRKKDIAGLVKKTRAHMDAEKPLRQHGATTDHLLKWSFSSRHTHSCGDHIAVSHIGCNLYVDPSHLSAGERVDPSHLGADEHAGASSRSGPEKK